MASKKTPDGYWTRERCFEEAKKYSSKQEFRTNCNSAYVIACRNGWINDYTWFRRPNMTQKWTPDACYKEAQKYKTKSEFMKNSSGAYAAALRNDWLKEYDWFIEICKHTGYWTKERCAEESNKCRTRTEFQKKYPSAYSAAWKNGWLDEITVHMKKRTYDTTLYSDKKYVIYIYKDNKNKVAYVGLTNNIIRRHKEHISLKNGIYDTVGNYFGTDVAFPDILFEELTADEAMQKEKEMFFQYKKDGWTMLNDETKLGTIGSAHQKWTRSKCRKEALKYKTLKEFREKSTIAYDTAIKNDWVKEYTWLKREQHSWWTREECFEEAKKYSSKQEFKKNSPSAYWAANRNKWMDDYIWFERPIVYNKKYSREICESESKKYKTPTEFMKKSRGAYFASCRNGWIKSFIWLY